MIPEHNNDEAVSDTVGFILIFGIVILSMGLIYSLGYPLLQSNMDTSIFESTEQSFIVLQSNMKMVSYDQVPVKNLKMKLYSAGLSSSSALAVAAIHAFSRMAGKVLSPQEVAVRAFEAEVVEFGESGGMQDHYASAHGGIIHLDLGADYETTRLPAVIEGLVIGDSLEKKEDTVADLRRIRTAIENEYRSISEVIPDFNQRTTSTTRVAEITEREPTEERKMAMARKAMVHRIVFRMPGSEIGKNRVMNKYTR